MNLHSSDIHEVMLEVAKEAFRMARRTRTTFADGYKKTRTGQARVTSTDRAIQAMAASKLDGLNGISFMGEETEDGIHQPPQHERYFLCDPVDGTNDFALMNIGGASFMLVMNEGGARRSAVVADYASGDIFHRSGDEQEVRRIFGTGGEAVIRLPSRSPSDVSLFIHGIPNKIGDSARAIAWGPDSPFRRFSSLPCGIGWSTMQLLVGKFGALILYAGVHESWDLMPVLALWETLGFVLFEMMPSGAFRQLDIPATHEPTMFEHEVLVLHRSNVAELMAWANR